jgi:glycosyltransferase involved in cell wall biosynthesis
MVKNISIVIPTLNRKNYLVETLEHLIPQVERNQNRVELIICNNASDDYTDSFMKTIIETKPFINYYYFEDRVDICESFSRSIAKCTGKYVIIWGDDDLPSPYFLETLLDSISVNQNLGLIHFNRVVGYDANQSLSSLSVCHRLYYKPSTLYDLNTFITNFFLDATFISSIMFLRSAWATGLAFNTKNHYGYEFLGVIYYGLRNLDCLYLNYPLCIQRKPLSRIWMNQWPLYSFIGTPNLLKDMEDLGIFKDGLNYWNKRINNDFIVYCYTLMWASAYKKQYRPLCSEINKYQTNYFRKFLTYFIIYLVPEFVFKNSRKIFFKQK